MSVERKANLRCAIYTRKSSEEGLEQSFNSLHAQREACEAFIASQCHEGWRVIPTPYDDGGYSGGTMERPALKRLLEDVKIGKIDSIVVYKVDRLTRSLSDFARIIDALDAHKVSFVSVTQQFNTTTSMGRLTLNVLLSFAQFEREVTGERIRDKIAASKKKGMWMGGFVPLGYDLKERTLIVNPQEAELVLKIVRLYLELGCVSKLKRRLDREGVRSKRRVSSTGVHSGGNFFSRGALYQLLRNRLYVGEVRHGDTWYPGQQEGIVARDLWDRVQAQMSSHNQGRKDGIRAASASLLTGLLRQANGNRYTPSHTVKNGKRYRYYVCRSANEDLDSQRVEPHRLPAHDVEKQVIARLQVFLRSEKDVFDYLSAPDNPALTQRIVTGAQELSSRWPSIGPTELRDLVRSVVQSVIIHTTSIELIVRKTVMRLLITNHQCSAAANNVRNSPSDDLLHLTLDAKLRRCGMEVRLVVPPECAAGTPRLAPSLLKAIARAHEWYKWALDGEAKDQASIARRAGLSERYVAKVFQCAFLAPDIVDSILAGSQPPELTFDKLCRSLPMSWVEQRRQLGFSPRHPE